MGSRRSLCAFVALGLAALYGCAGVTQRVKGLESTPGDLVCVIQNPDVRYHFFAQYQRTLEQLGYRIRQLPVYTPLTDCPLSSTYVARWTGVVLAFAEIRVFTDGAESGNAVYDRPWWAQHFGWDRFIDVDAKIEELTRMLYPPRVPQP